MAPAGYERLLLGHAVAVARTDLASSIRGALVAPDGAAVTLHEYAARHPSAKALRGRGTAYAVTLPGNGTRVVVRHNRRGGAMARLTRDYFVTPTRAPHELELSLALRARGVPTPEIVAYALYPPGGLVQRADVCSVEVPASRDFADVVMHARGDERGAIFEAVADLVARMSRAGVRHHDLNAKNILVANDRALVIDVDRVTMDASRTSALEGNLGRLVRSLRKWRDDFGAPVTEPEIARLESETRRRAS